MPCDRGGRWGRGEEVLADLCSDSLDRGAVALARRLLEDRGLSTMGRRASKGGRESGWLGIDGCFGLRHNDVVVVLMTLLPTLSL